jgi:hypothetical protein
MRSVVSLNGQNLWDITLRHMGSVDSIFDVVALNPAIRIDETLDAGRTIYLPDNADKQRVVDYYELNDINPSTGIVNE